MPLRIEEMDLWDRVQPAHRYLPASWVIRKLHFPTPNVQKQDHNSKIEDETGSLIL